MSNPSLQAASPALPVIPWVVTGRIPGDDEDSSYVIHASTKAAAIDAFEASIWGDGDPSPEARAAVHVAHGQATFINSVHAVLGLVVDATDRGGVFSAPDVIKEATTHEAEITSYCQQVCGGPGHAGCGGSASVCRNGIDKETEMPPALTLADLKALRASHEAAIAGLGEAIAVEGRRLTLAQHAIELMVHGASMQAPQAPGDLADAIPDTDGLYGRGFRSALESVRAALQAIPLDVEVVNDVLLTALDAYGNWSEQDEAQAGEVQQVLCCSTGHLTHSERDAMSDGECADGLVLSASGDHGYLIWVGSHEEGPDLQSIEGEIGAGFLGALQHARRIGAPFVRFDADGGYLPGAPTYE